MVIKLDLPYLRKLARLIWRYKSFSVALLALIIGLILQLSGQVNVAHWLLGIVAILETLPIAWEMIQNVRLGRYGIDILAATSIVASVILGQYWAAIVVILMLSGGQSLENLAETRAKSELTALLSKVPHKANLLKKGKVMHVAVSSIKSGDKLVIKPGEVVPVDAKIIEGKASFDESSLTGESVPGLKQVGDHILSGSLNLDGAVTVKSLATAEDSQYQQIIKLVKSATASQAPLVRLADKYSVPFTIVAYAIALAVWALTGQAIRFLEVIIVATPCPLLLAAPVALVSGMARASRYGIIVKSGKALEVLAKAKTVAFDKTGTLTKGKLTVSSIKAFGKYGNDEVLRLAASLSQNSNHVLSKAVVAKAKSGGIKTIKVKHLEELAGLGLKASVKGTEILLGNYELLAQHDVKSSKTFKPTSINQTATYLSVDGYLAGTVVFTDELRPEAKATLRHLHGLGIKDVAMITGDNLAVAQSIAKKLGIDEVHAGALPADKLNILKRLRPRPVIFIGDGINDAPVLASADVGIALGARGVAAASESADMVIMLDDLSHVAAGLEVAKRTFAIAKQSILVGIGLSLCLMLVFASGLFPPLAGALVQEVVDVFVILNTLRAHVIVPSMVD